MEKKHYIDMELVKKLMEEKNIDVQTMANSVGLTSKTLKKYLDGADQTKNGSGEFTGYDKREIEIEYSVWYKLV